MTPTVSVVIPTIGRPTLAQAVQSVLAQTYPVAEVIVIADTDQPLSLPSDGRIVMRRTETRSGPARSRQMGIDLARGAVIALLDDDDEWHSTKLARQLHAVDSLPDGHWIASSRTVVRGPGDRERTWPRRLAQPGESISDYLFRFTDLGFGGAMLQTSTLCFPAELAREVRWDAHADEPHDEPSWLIQVQRTVPDVRVVQLPEALSTYNVTTCSVSRDRTDHTDEYIEWGLHRLSTESPRVLGDYLCTSAVSAAVSARSLGGVRRSITSGLRYGRPGPFALLYAMLSGARIVLRRLAPVAAR